jgi:hypothetical protein
MTFRAQAAAFDGWSDRNKIEGKREDTLPQLLDRKIRPQSGRRRPLHLPAGSSSGTAKPSARSARPAFEGTKNSYCSL